MKPTTYLVWFATENYAPQCVRVEAFNQDAAIILAKAARIKEGLDYTLNKVELLD